MSARVRVRKADAVKVLNAVRRQFKAWIDPDNPNSGPWLAKDWDFLGYGAAPYAIVWEGGPYEWTTYARDGGIEEEFGSRIAAVDFPDTVFTEAITSWALGVYEA